MNTIEITATELAADETELLDTTAVVVEASDDPPNPVLPTGNEIFWSAIFFLLLWFLMKFVLLPPIRAIQKKRAEEIESGRDIVDTTSTEKEKFIQEREEALASVRQEAAQIIEEARQRGEEFHSGLMAEVNAEIAQLQEENEVSLTAASQAAMESLQEDIYDLTYKAASLVLGNDPDSDLVNASIEEAKSKDLGEVT